MTDIETDAQLLRLAVQQLACAPQAQRRTVQLGHMPRAVDNLQRIAADLDPLVDAGLLDEEQADLVRALRDALVANLESHDDFLELRDSAPREFLLGNALETDDWHALRLTARRAYHAIHGDKSPFIAIMAK
jgi:hypothetical protein